MAFKNCKDIMFNENVKAVHFDGTANSIKDLQSLLAGSNQINMNTLHTRIGWWAVKYKDGSIVWKRNKCFDTNYEIIN